MFDFFLIASSFIVNLITVLLIFAGFNFTEDRFKDIQEQNSKILKKLEELKNV